MKVNFCGWLCRLNFIFLLLIAPGTVAFDLKITSPGAGQPAAITFDTAPGVFYDVETSTNLLSWNVLRTLRAQSSQGAFLDLDSNVDPARFYRVADLSDNMVVEGLVTSPDGKGVPDHCPFCDILVSSSLDTSTTYTDTNGRFILRTQAAAAQSNLPFTLYFSKIGFRAHSSVVTNPTISRVEVMTLAGPSNNDFDNRLVIAGSATNTGDNAIADVEAFEPGGEPSVWYSFTAPRSGTLRFAIDTTEFLPMIQFFKGQDIATLEPAHRSTVSNYVEWRIEVTHDLSVYAGEQFQIRVGAGPHPTREVTGGPLEWRCIFEPDFPLVIDIANTNRGSVIVDPPPNANGRYAPGAKVHLRAVPGSSHTFVGWSGSVESPTPELLLTIDEPKVIRPHFVLANGDIGSATIISQGTPEGEAYIPLGGVIWYSWTPQRLTPVVVGFQTTNVVYGTVYRKDGTNLVYVSDNKQGHQLSTSFWGSNAVTYLLAVNLAPDKQGTIQFNSSEPIVMQGIVRGTSRYTVTGRSSTATFSAYFNPSYYTERFEIWTSKTATAADYPHTLSITAAGFRPASATVYANGEAPIIPLQHTGSDNNDFTNSAGLSTAPWGTGGTLEFSDVEAGEQGMGPGSIWYKFTAAEGGTLFITNTTRAAWETTVWTGTDLATLQRQPSWLLDRDIYSVAGEYSVPAGKTSYIRFGGYNRPIGHVSFRHHFVPGYPLRLTNAQPQAGSVIALPASSSHRYAANANVTVYAVPSAGYRFAGWTGDIQSLNSSAGVLMTGQKTVQANFVLRNDHFDDRISIAGLPVTAQGTNLYGTAESGEPSHAGFPASSSAWWRWLSPLSTDVVLEFDFLDVSIGAAVYTGNSLATLVQIANNHESRDVRKIRFRATAGATYRIAVDAHGDGGPYAFTIRPVPEARYSLDTENVEGGYAMMTPEPDGNSEYASGTTVMLSAVTLNAWKFSHWEETSSGTSVVLGTNDILELVMHHDRRIAPRFMQAAEPRTNDAFSDRHMLFVPGPMVRANNDTASVEVDEPKHSATGSGRSLWWSWTAHLSTRITFHTSGSSFDHVMAVYRGSGLAGLTLMARRENRAEELGGGVSFMAEAGVTYHVAIDGLNGESGDIQIRAVRDDQFTLELLSPVEGHSMVAPGTVLLAAEALNSDLTVTQLTLFTNNVAAVISTNGGASFVWSNIVIGTHTVHATGMDVHGRTVSAGPHTISAHRYYFPSNSFIGREREGTALVSVHREGPTNVGSRIYFEVGPGTALWGQHYVPCAGDLYFRPGETNLLMALPLVIDEATDVTRAFEVRIMAKAGAPPLHTGIVNTYDSFPTTSFGFFDDKFPANVAWSGDFTWIEHDPLPAFGLKARESTGIHEVKSGLGVTSGSYMWQEVFIDPIHPPRFIAVKWRYGAFYSGTACWGDRALAGPSDVWLGPLPEPGVWWQLIIPNLVTGNIIIQELQWTVIDGRAVWDRTGFHVWR